MIQISDLSKSFGSQKLLNSISFSVNRGERVGVVGRNGHGKSTLFKMILGLESYDSGLLQIPKNYKIGHLSQKLIFSEKTVIDEASIDLPTYEGGWKETYKAESILQGLGFNQEQFQMSPDKLSGGFQIRLNLAKLLSSEPNLLLLDEPTNYLDIPSVRWLIRFLQNWNEEMMIITHDRGFMDQVTTHTLSIHRGSVKKVEGDTKKLYKQITLEEEIHEKTRENQLKQRAKTEEFINRFRAKASKASAVQSKIKMLDKLPTLDELEDIHSLSFRFNSVPFSGKFILHVKNLDFSYKKDIPMITNLNFSIQKNDRIGIIGKNGKGKTTLLNLVAGDLTPDNGEILFSDNAKLTYFGQTNVERLDPKSSIEHEVAKAQPGASRTLIRNLCGAMMFSGDSALKKIEVLSGGEKSRVLLAKVLAQPSNILLLDEPTNHLDMESAEELKNAITAYDGTVLFVTHDEELIRAVTNRLIIFDGGKVSFFEGGYDDFLRRVGWHDEEEEHKTHAAPDSSTSKLNKKELRQKRAAEKEALQKLLKPIKKSIQETEKKIITAEEQIEKEQSELIAITQNGFGDDAVSLTRSIAENKKEIEELFEKLEELNKEKERIESDQ